MRNRLKYLLITGGLVLIGIMMCGPLKAEDKPPSRIIHGIRVVLDPEARRFTALDTITLPDDYPGEFQFELHRGLEPLSRTAGAAILPGKAKDGVVPVETYTVQRRKGLNTFTISYGGVIYHPLESSSGEQARGFSDSPGIISDEGVYLSSSSYWYPIADGSLVTFYIDVDLPPGWDAVSQGERTEHRLDKDKTSTRWESPEPQDEIFLIAARFTEYAERTGTVQAMAFLRSPDNDLAQKYLDAMQKYISMYEKLIGDYPYRKFALVENFWESGLGMPSFTLLGSRIIRLPFIINSSFPHEILHNWWGNSVFPDYQKGNWAEGLTAYLSDHLMKEQQGTAAEYRQTTLQKYADYVLQSRDFPLSAFIMRHSSSSEAVGYGKSLMFFNMLRNELGDDIFIKGLQGFYRDNRFRFASFDDLRMSFEKVSGRDLRSLFDQWVNRTGAPRLRLKDAKVSGEGNHYVLSLELEQAEPGEAYRLKIPISVTMEGRERAHQTVLSMDTRRCVFTIPLESRPVRVDVDPEFDLFRRLDKEEIPPAVTQVLGSERLIVLLPASAEGDMLRAYQAFSRLLATSGPGEVESRFDNEVKQLPADRTVVILGWENAYVKEALRALSVYGVNLNEHSLSIGRSEVPRENHSAVLTARNPENRDRALMFIASSSPTALSGLGKKLPHYHKYSYLGFEGDEPANMAKGRWPVLDSPMTAWLPGSDGRVGKTESGRLSERVPLAALPVPFSSDAMIKTITFLSGSELKGRGRGTEGLDKAAGFIAERFREAGLKPAGDSEGSYFQVWQDQESNKVMKNVVAVIPGEKAELAGQSVVIGAHYDHLGFGLPGGRKEDQGKLHPGADDNASGVSVMIELARVLSAGFHPDRTLAFVAFAGEETGRAGSKHYAANEKDYPVEKSVAMLNLDTVGRLGKQKLLVLGANSAREWVHIFRGAGFVTGVDIETVSDILDSSDNISFNEAGVPAVQLFSGPHLDYHRPTDTVDKIDGAGLVKVASVAREVIEYLANREGPLTASLGNRASAEQPIRKERKVTIGTVPDFSYTGRGCRLSGVVPGSPAESCSLRQGDIIVRINSTVINSLKDLSEFLKSLTPGTRISITFLRDGKEMTVETEVIER